MLDIELNMQLCPKNIDKTRVFIFEQWPTISHVPFVQKQKHAFYRHFGTKLRFWLNMQFGRCHY